MKLKDKIENWYQGTYVPPPKNNPNDPFVFMSLGHYEKSAGAKIAEFHLKHWVVLTPIYITLLGVLVTFLVYIDPLNKSNKTTTPNKTEQQKKNGNTNNEEPLKNTKEIENLKI